MKITEVAHNLSLLYEALKTNKAAWDNFNKKIKALKAKEPIGIKPDIKTQSDLIFQRNQVHAVIILLTNSMIEALANFYLAEKCDQEQFEVLERMSTLDKLLVAPKFFLKEYEFPKSETLYSDLKHLLSLRTSIVHSKPKIVVNGQIIHRGNIAKKDSITSLLPDKCLSLPIHLVEHLCLYDHGGAFGLCIYSGFDKTVTQRIILKVRAKSLKKRTVK